MKRAVTFGAITIVVLAGCSREQRVQLASRQAPRAASETVAEAKGRAADHSSVTIRRVWSGPGVDFFGKPFPDGRAITFVDWDTGDLAVRDLASNASRRVTNKGSFADSEEYAENSIVSPDGDRIAYAWWNGDDDGFYELRVIGADGSGMRPLLRNRELGEWIQPHDWSPDGRWVLATVIGKGTGARATLISVADGSMRVLKSFDWRRPSVMSFSPDLRFIAYDMQADAKSENRELYVFTPSGTRETRLTNSPDRESLLGWLPDGSGLLFSRGNGAGETIWMLPLVDGRRAGDPIVVRRDIFQMTAIGRSLNAFFYGVTTENPTIYTAALDLAGRRLLSVATPIVDPRRVRIPAWSPDGSHLAYVTVPVRPGPPAVAIRSMQTGEVRALTPDLRYVLQLSWAPDGKSLFASGARARTGNGVYRIDLTTAQVQRVAETRGAATHAISPDGNTLYFHAMSPEPDRGGIFARDLRSDSEWQVYAGRPTNQNLAIAPDGRQLAFTTFERATKTSYLMTISTQGGEPRRLVHLHDPESFSYGVLGWSPDGKNVLFVKQTEASDDAPASAPTHTLYSVPAAGGEPAAVFSHESLLRFKLSPDGRRVAFQAGQWKGEVWVMENLPRARPAAKGGAQ